MNTSLTPRPPLDDIALELCALSKVYPLKRGLFQAPGEPVSYTHLTLPTKA